MSFQHIFKYVAVATVFSFAIACTSCKRHEHDHTEPDTNKKGDITIKFDNVAGSSNLALNTAYTNASDETFKVTTLKYYISNIKLKTETGTVYTVPQNESYFLIDEATASSQNVKINVPEGNYSEVTFMVGVDSLRSTSDISQRTGVLDPATGGAGMYWVWNSGYIHFKLEGTHTASDSPFKYHVGGYGGYSQATKTLNNTRTITLPFGASRANVRADHNDTSVHLLVDVLKVFTGTNTIKIADKPTMMGITDCAAVANNFVGVFKFDHVHSH